MQLLGTPGGPRVCPAECKQLEALMWSTPLTLDLSTVATCGGAPVQCALAGLPPAPLTLSQLYQSTGDQKK